MADVRIPSSIEEVTERLAALDALLTAKGWERAAIVWAFTRNDGPGRPRNAGEHQRLTMRQFADLKIAGLRDWKRVEHYRSAWSTVVETHGDPRPGQVVILPDPERYPFPPSFDAGWPAVEHRDGIEEAAAEIGTGVTIPVQIARNPKALEAAIAGSPEVAEAAAEALAKHRPETARRVVRERDDERIAAAPRLEPLEKPEANEPLDDMGLTVALGAFERAAVAVADAIRRPIVDPEMRDTVAATFANVRNIMTGAEQLAAGFDPEDLLR